MEIPELKSFCNDISDCLQKNIPFSIQHKEGALIGKREELRGKEREGIEILYQFLAYHLRVSDNRELSGEQMDIVHHLIQLYNALITAYPENHDQAKLLSLQLGGKIPYTYLEDREREVIVFLRENRLPEFAIPLKIDLRFDPQKGVGFPVEIEPYIREEIFFNALERKGVLSESGKLAFYRFYREGVALFETDLHLKLKDPFAVGFGGIYKIGNEMRAIDHKDPKESATSSLVELWLTREGEFFLTLKDRRGRCYSVTMQKGRLISLPHKNQGVCLQIEVAEEELEEMLQALSKERKQRVSKRYFLNLLEKGIGVRCKGSLFLIKKKMGKLDHSFIEKPDRAISLEVFS